MHPLPHEFASPVPTHNVLPVGSFGSSAIEPTELMPNGPLRYCQLGWPLNAFFVRQMPPPAGATQSRQFPSVQLGSMARATVRPPAI